MDDDDDDDDDNGPQRGRLDKQPADKMKEVNFGNRGTKLTLVSSIVLAPSRIALKKLTLIA